MKNLYLFLLIPVILFLQPPKTYATDKLTDDSKSEFTAKVNGKDFKASIRSCNIVGSSVEIMGMSDDYFSISFTLDGPPREGTFEINKTSKNKAMYGKVGSKYIVGENDGGNVIVTKYDAANKLFSGTFELKLTNEKTGEKVTITGGKFSNLYIYEEAETENKLEAKLNDSKWMVESAVFAVISDTANIGGSDPLKSLILKFPANTPPGIYAFDRNGNNVAEYISLDGTAAPLKSKAGKLIILSNDSVKKLIKGRFEIELEDASGKNKAKFTEGIFVLSY